MAVNENKWGVLYCPKHSWRDKNRWAKIRRVLDAHGVDYDYVQSENVDSVERLVKMLINNGYKNAGLYVRDGANLTVRGVTFAPAAGESVNVGIAVDSGCITVEDCKFDNVKTGIYVETADSVEIINCTFTNCKAGISLSGITTSATVSNDCVFTNNNEDIGLKPATFGVNAVITYPTDTGLKVNEYDA